jgi:DNA-binding NarL/FixJ family response regulator
MSNKEIARALDLQLSTVKNHVHNVLTKLGAAGRRDIAGVLARLDADPVPEPIST